MLLILGMLWRFFDGMWEKQWFHDDVTKTAINQQLEASARNLQLQNSSEFIDCEFSEASLAKDVGWFLLEGGI